MKENSKEKYYEDQYEKKEQPINIAEIWVKMVNQWYFFAIVLVVCAVLAFLVNKYSSPKYEASTTMLIKTNNDVLSNLDLEVGMMWSNENKDYQNAIKQLQSYSIARETVKAMNLHCSYYQRINFRDIDVYKDSPFEVIPDVTVPQPTGVKLNIRLINEKQCRIFYNARQNVPTYDYLDDKVSGRTVNLQNRNVIINYGDWFNIDGMRFKVVLKKDKWNTNLAKVEYSFILNSFESLAYSFQNITVNPLGDGSSIVRLSFTHQNNALAIDYVNKLCSMFIDQSFNEKNALNITTIDFVNQQLTSIGDSLSQAESRKEAFQESHNTLNLTNDGQYLYQKTNELQEKRAEAFTKQQYYDYLEDYILNAGLDQGVTSPSVMGVNDPVLTKLVGELSDVIIQHKTALTKRSDKNPKNQELELKILTIRKQISESLKNLQKVSSITKNQLDRQQNQLQVSIDRLPSTERNLVNIQRQFKFNDEIYSFLYKKRAEAEIAKNAANPDHKVVDKCISAVKIYPKSIKNYLIALVVGLLIPAVIIILKYLLKDTLDSRDDLVKLSHNPIIGYIPQFPEDANPMIVLSKPRSYIAESYRTIRTNIKYILGEKEGELEQGKGKIILVTSSMPGEGKTTTSMNLASVFSISGGKTLLVEFDLRKPSLHKKLGLDPTKSISSFYVGRHSALEICQRTEFDNLDAVCVGQVPPNPSEIIDSVKIKQMVEELKKNYDYIILDTPPINLIADAQSVAKLADISIIIARVGVTSISILRTSIQEMEERTGVTVNFILNGVQSALQKYGYGKGSYSGYGRYGRHYGYAYGGRYSEKTYGYGYYDEGTTDKK